MVIHANDLNSWEKGTEPAFDVNEDAPVSSGGTKPNAFTKWATPGTRDPRVQRPVDLALKEIEGSKKACEKCGFQTTSQDAWVSHNREDSAGKILCEREKAAFREQERCRVCEGEGHAGPKGMPCAACSGLGFVPKKDQPAQPAPQAIDVDLLAAKITAGLSKTLNDGFAQVAMILKGEEPKKPKKQKGKSDDGRSRVGRGGAPASRPAPGPVLGQPEQPVADPPAEPT
jgi:hypothetical protein